MLNKIPYSFEYILEEYNGFALYNRILFYKWKRKIVCFL